MIATTVTKIRNAINVPRSKLSFTEKVTVMNLLNQPGLEFETWQAAIDYVKNKTDITTTRANLQNLRKSTNLTFKIASNTPLHNAITSPKYGALVQRVKELEDRMQHLEKELGVNYHAKS